MVISTESQIYPVVDAHLDLAYNAVALERNLVLSVDALREYERKPPPVDVHAKEPMVTWPALKEGYIAIVGGSIFVEPFQKFGSQITPCYHTPQEAHAQAVAQLDYYRRVSDHRDDVAMIVSTRDLDSVWASWEADNPITGIFVVMEGADPITEPRELGWWVERGLRGVGLAWSAGTRYAGGNANPGPLTDEGESLIRAMAEYNLLLDVSHLSEDAVVRVLDCYPGPIVATHANPRAFVDSPRSLADTTISRIAERGGVIGIVAFNRMLDPDWRPGQPRLPLARLIEAIDHVCQITGHACAVGIGSDFDGGFGQSQVPAELDSVADLRKIGDRLRDWGYGELDITRVLHGNWLRVMREAVAAF